jgi:hypothetical protein
MEEIMSKYVKLLQFVFFSSLLTNTVFAQIIWQRSYGGTLWDYGTCIQQTNDGGYIATGSTNSFGNEDQVYLIRIDSLGDTLWTKTYGGTADDYGRSVQQTTDSGYIVVGGTISTPHNWHVLLIKTDSLGGMLWSRAYGTGAWDTYTHGQSVQQTVDGGYAIVGKTNVIDAYYQILLMKTNAMGDSLWAKMYGGGGSEEGLYVQQSQDGGYVIVGTSRSWGNDDQVYVIKTDTDGNTAIKEDKIISLVKDCYGPTIFSGSLHLPLDKNCKVLDITGRVVAPDKIKPGIYFIEVHGKLTTKVIKIK